MTWMYLTKCIWKPAKTEIIRLYRTAFRVDHESAHNYFIHFDPKSQGTYQYVTLPYLAGKTRGSLGRRKGKKGLLRSSTVADIFPNWPLFFFLFPFSGAWSQARLCYAPVRKSYPDEQSESYQNHRSLCEQKSYFCGRKGIRYHSMNKACDT